MANLIVALAVAGAVGAACRHIYKEKKRGTACIGCPMAESCGKACGCDGSKQKGRR